MSTSYVFYGLQLVDQVSQEQITTSIGRYILNKHGKEIYDGGYLYAQWFAGTSSIEPYGWWRCDMTPILLDHVPKELRVLALLLT